MRLLAFILCTVAWDAFGATYYISPSGSNATGNGSEGNPWQTLEYAAKTRGYLQAGDTLYVRQGQYQGLTNVLALSSGVGNSGTSGSRITVRNYPGEMALFCNTTNASTWVFNLQGKSYWTLSGLMFSNVHGAMVISSCTNLVITNCTITRMPIGLDTYYADYSAGAILFISSSQSNIMTHCTVTNWGTSFPRSWSSGEQYSNQWQVAGSPCTANSDEAAYGDYTYYNLFENNTFARCGHDLFGVAMGFTTIRSNLFYNDPWRPTNEIQGWTYYNYGNPQPWRNLSGAWGARAMKQGIGNNDFTMQGQNANGVDARNVVEDNVILYCAIPADSNDGTGLGIASRCGIYRRNIVAYSQSGGIYLEHSGGMTRTAAETNNPAFYHAGMTLIPPCGGTNSGMSTLNAIYGNVSYCNGTMFPLGVPEETTNNIRFPAYGLCMGSDRDINNYFANNIFFSNYPQDIEDNNTNRQVWYTNWVGQYGSPNPLFVKTNAVGYTYNAADLPDFHLTTNSPCIDAGTWLTTTIGASNASVTMVVFNSLYFSDGNHMVTGDTVQLQGQTNRAVVLANDWTNNILTLDTALSWTNGQGVALAYNGAAPDMGAFETSGENPPPEPPGGETVTTNRIGAGTFGWGRF